MKDLTNGYKGPPRFINSSSLEAMKLQIPLERHGMSFSSIASFVEFAILFPVVEDHFSNYVVNFQHNDSMRKGNEKITHFVLGFRLSQF